MKRSEASQCRLAFASSPRAEVAMTVGPIVAAKGSRNAHSHGGGQQLLGGCSY